MEQNEVQNLNLPGVASNSCFIFETCFLIIFVK